MRGYALEDICEGPATREILLRPADFLNVAAMLTQAPRVACGLRAAYDEADGSFTLAPHVELPFAHRAASNRFLVHGKTGFVWSRPLTATGAEGRGVFTPLAHVLERLKTECTAIGGVVADIEYSADVCLKLLLPEDKADAFSQRTADVTAGASELEITGEEFKPVRIR